MEEEVTGMRFKQKNYMRRKDITHSNSLNFRGSRIEYTCVVL